MYPQKPEDFFVSEPLGDLLFIPESPTLYYAEFIEYERVGQDMFIPNKIVVRKVNNFDFLANMSGYFSQGKYRIEFKMGEDSLYADEFGRRWSFDKDDVISWLKKDPIYRYIELEVEK